MLKYTTKKIIDCYDLDELVTNTYGKPYCFQQQDDCKSRGTEHITVPVTEPYDYENDSIPEKVNGEQMGVSFKAWLERDPKATVDGRDDHAIGLFWDRNFYPSLDMIVNDLHKKGLIEAGDYIIEIDW